MFNFVSLIVMYIYIYIGTIFMSWYIGLEINNKNYANTQSCDRLIKFHGVKFPQHLYHGTYSLSTLNFY